MAEIFMVAKLIWVNFNFYDKPNFYDNKSILLELFLLLELLLIILIIYCYYLFRFLIFMVTKLIWVNNAKIIGIAECLFLQT